MDDLEHELEQEIHRRLKALPAPRAPRTLLPSVLMAVAALGARPWYARPWRSWSLGLQLASAALVFGIVAGVSLLIQTVGPNVLPATAWTSFDTAMTHGATTLRVAAVCWRAIVQPVALLALVPLLMMCTASIVFGAALGRLAFGGPSQI